MALKRGALVATGAAVLLSGCADDSETDSAVSPTQFLRETAYTLNGMSFTVKSCNKASTKGHIMFLHGVPNQAEMWEPIMQQMCEEGWHSVAFDQRGHSESSPTDIDRYDTNLLREDVFAVADVMDMHEFNLVGHDEGALLGYYVLDSESGRDRVVSFTALNCPHPNALSDAVYTSGDQEQKWASQGTRLMMDQGSVERIGEDMRKTLFGENPGVTDLDQMQRLMYWYGGQFLSGMIAQPRLYSKSELEDQGAPGWLLELRGMFPHLAAHTAEPQRVVLQPVNVPVLYIAAPGNKLMRATDTWALTGTRQWCRGEYSELILESDSLVDPDDVVSDPAVVASLKVFMLEIEEIEVNETETARRERTTEEPIPILENPVLYVAIGIAVGFVGLIAFVTLTNNEDDEEMDKAEEMAKADAVGDIGDVGDMTSKSELA